MQVVGVADVDAVVVEVEPERRWVAVAEGERRGGLDGVVEADAPPSSRDGAVGVAMSRSTPPAPIAASCWSSPISRTLGTPFEQRTG